MLFKLKVHSYLYSFIPFGLIFILNALLLFYIYKSTKTIQNFRSSILKKQISISVTILTITFLFIIATAPGAVISQFYNVLVRSEHGLIVLFSGDNITFSYHAFTLIILSLTNKEFLRKFRESNQVTVYPTNNSQAQTNMKY